MKILPFLPPTQLCDVSAAALCWSISDKLILRHILHKTGGLWTFVLSDFWTRTSDWLCARKVTSCGCTDWQRHIACVFSIFVFSNFLIFAFLYYASFCILPIFVFLHFLYFASAQCKNIKISFACCFIPPLFFCFWSAFSTAHHQSFIVLFVELSLF